MTWVDGNKLNVEIDNENVIFTDKNVGDGILDCLEYILGDVNYIYYHCGDNNSKIVISKKDYDERKFIKDSIENGWRY